MNKIKVAAALLLIVVILASTGCSKGTTPSEDNITLNIYNQNTTESGPVSGWFAQIIKSKFNINLYVIPSNELGFAAYVEEGNLGDIIIFNRTEDYRTAYKAGLLYDWNQYDILNNYGSSLLSNYKEALEKNRSMNSDGAIHGISGNISINSVDYITADTSYIRWDLYKKLGYPEINTLEDLEMILKDMVELERADTSSDSVYAISAFSEWDDVTPYLLSSTAKLYGYMEFGLGFYNPSTDSYELCLDEDGIYMRCLKFYNALYRAGLFDPDSMNQDYDHTQQNYAKGKALFSPDSDLASSYNTAAHIADNKSMLPLSANDFSVLGTSPSIYGDGSIFCISNNSAYPEYSMQVIDFIFSEEGAIDLKNGPKGSTWDYAVDDSGNKTPYITELGLKCFEDATTELTGDYSGRFADGFLDLSCDTLDMDCEYYGNGITLDSMTWPSVKESDWYIKNADKPVDMSDWSSYTGYSTISEYLKGSGITLCPDTTFVFGEMDSEIAFFKNTIASELCTYSWNAIYADDEYEFNSIVSDMNTLITSHWAYDEILEHYNEQLKIYKASINN